MAFFATFRFNTYHCRVPEGAGDWSMRLTDPGVVKRYARAVVLGVTCFALGAVFQRMCDASETCDSAGSADHRVGAEAGVRITEQEGCGLRVDSIRSPAAVGMRIQRRPSPATRPPASPSDPESAPERTLWSRPRRGGRREQRHVFARGRPRRSQRDRLVSRRPPADAQRRRARSGADGEGDSRMRLVSPAKRQGTSGKCAAGGAAGRLYHAAVARLPRGPAMHRRPEEAEHAHDDRPGESPDRQAMNAVCGISSPRSRGRRGFAWSRRTCCGDADPGNLFLPVEKSPTEPIAGRIIEVPEDLYQAETYRNPHSGWVAYVPVRAACQKGQDLVTTGHRIVDNKIVQSQDNRLHHLPQCWISRVVAVVPASPAARPATWCASCGICNRARGTARGWS